MDALMWFRGPFGPIWNLSSLLNPKNSLWSMAGPLNLAQGILSSPVSLNWHNPSIALGKHLFLGWPGQTWSHIEPASPQCDYSGGLLSKRAGNFAHSMGGYVGEELDLAEKQSVVGLIWVCAGTYGEAGSKTESPRLFYLTQLTNSSSYNFYPVDCHP